MNDTVNMAGIIYSNMNRILADEDERGPEIGKIDLLDDDVTNFFTAELLALKLQYQNLVGDSESDLIDFISILNKLAIQYVMDNKEKKQ